MNPMGYGIFLIRRPKLNNAPGWHYAVMSQSVVVADCVDIIDLDGSGAIRHGSSIEEWEQGLEHEPVSECPPSEILAAEQRMRDAIDEGRGYHLLENNCEHFARWTVAGVRESHQVRAVVGVALLIGVAFLMAQG